MTLLYPILCFKKVCYKVTALYIVVNCRERKSIKAPTADRYSSADCKWNGVLRITELHPPRSCR